MRSVFLCLCVFEKEDFWAKFFVNLGINPHNDSKWKKKKGKKKKKGRESVIEALIDEFWGFPRRRRWRKRWWSNRNRFTLGENNTIAGNNNPTDDTGGGGTMSFEALAPLCPTNMDYRQGVLGLTTRGFRAQCWEEQRRRVGE